MENKINIAEILKDCPKGMKLYSPAFGESKLYQINNASNYPIVTKDEQECAKSYTSNGHFDANIATAECILFPSSKMRDWTKFFKRGDVVWSKDNMYAIFEGWANDDYTKFNSTICIYAFDASFDEEVVCDTDCFVKAREEERATFIANAEKHYNGKYNPDTLQVEPVKPTCPFKPFDKVLVRDNDEGEWYANYFSHYKENNDIPYVCIDNSYIYCIPYEGNEHLLGTSEAYTEGGSE